MTMPPPLPPAPGATLCIIATSLATSAAEEDGGAEQPESPTRLPGAPSGGTACPRQRRRRRRPVSGVPGAPYEPPPPPLHSPTPPPPPPAPLAALDGSDGPTVDSPLAPARHWYVMGQPPSCAAPRKPAADWYKLPATS